MDEQINSSQLEQDGNQIISTTAPPRYRTIENPRGSDDEEGKQRLSEEPPNGDSGGSYFKGRESYDSNNR